MRFSFPLAFFSLLASACGHDADNTSGPRPRDNKRDAPSPAAEPAVSALDARNAWRMSTPLALRPPTRAIGKRLGVPWSNRTRTDINGDGRTDILWYNDAIPAVAYWAMNGASIVDRASYWTAPNYQLLGTGDFDGDGRHDLVWAHPSSQSIFVWQGYDQGFEYRWVTPYPNPYFAPWVAVPRIADINGDMKPDLLYQQSFSAGLNRGYFLAQVMNAYWTLQYSSLGSGAAPAADVDLLGVGRVQQLRPYAVGTSQQRLAIQEFHGDFLTIRDIDPAPLDQARSEFIAAGDINTDGIPDLLWFNPDARHLEVMVMARQTGNPSTPFVRHRRLFGIPPAYRLAAVGDYDGDGFQDDILWDVSASRELYLWTGRGDTTFDSTYVGHYAEGWRVVFTGR